MTDPNIDFEALSPNEQTAISLDCKCSNCPWCHLAKRVRHRGQVREMLREEVSWLAKLINQEPWLWDYYDGQGGLIAEMLMKELENLGWHTEWKPNQPRSIVRRLAERDGWQCTYCGTDLDGKPDRPETHVDHVIPKSRGGSESLDNKVLACRPCNLSKSARTPEEWRAAQ